MNRRLRKIAHLILAALLLTTLLLMAGTTAAAKKHFRRYNQRRAFVERPRRAFVERPIGLGTVSAAQPVRPFSTFGPFGRNYHPYWDPYGGYDHHTFYRHSLFGNRRR
ncbi:MAG TPA: hypothetical protein VLL54_19725 [Pyrinomonadaceae bacterium]|nr:hypothetical protein [Pyrinomonadaceae bacterium]